MLSHEEALLLKKLIKGSTRGDEGEQRFARVLIDRETNWTPEERLLRSIAGWLAELETVQVMSTDKDSNQPFSTLTNYQPSVLADLVLKKPWDHLKKCRYIADPHGIEDECDCKSLMKSP